MQKSERVAIAKHIHDCKFSSVNAIFPNTVVGGAGPLPILFYQRTEPMTEPGICQYNFRLYGRKNAPPEEKAAALKAVDMFMKVSLEEDLPAQASCQVQMELGAVPSIIFGKRESALAGRHKMYDEVIGHDVDAALRSNSVKMGISAIG